VAESQIKEKKTAKNHGKVMVLKKNHQTLLLVMP
jgi:hypothetical protein